MLSLGLVAAIEGVAFSASAPPSTSLFKGMSEVDHAHYEATAIRLWADRAPQAQGDTPADIPLLYPVLPNPGSLSVGAILVLPGGGYRDLAAHEGFPIATHFRSTGLAAFGLKYRLRPYGSDVSLQDAQRAVRLIRARAKELGVDPERIAVIGFSAGGHLAANVATH